MEQFEALLKELDYYDSEACSYLARIGVPRGEIPHLTQCFIENPSKLESQLNKDHPHFKSLILLIAFRVSLHETLVELVNGACGLEDLSRRAFNLGFNIGMVAPTVGVEVLEWEKARLARYAKEGKAFDEGRHAEKKGVLRECVLLAIDYFESMHGETPTGKELLATMKTLQAIPGSDVNRIIQEFDDEEERIFYRRKNGKEAEAKYKRVADLLSIVAPKRSRRKKLIL